MVKGGRLAAWLRAPGPGRKDILVDCYANRGFSGGPLVGFLPTDGQGRAVGIFGVVSHYVPEHQPVISVDGRVALSTEANPGILVVHDIQHALDAIMRTPTAQDWREAAGAASRTQPGCAPSEFGPLQGLLR